MKRNLRKAVSCVLALSVMAVLLSSCGGSGSGEVSKNGIVRSNEFITVATGPTSGIYYPIGGAFANVLSTAGYKTSAQATGASVENINLITQDDAELAISMQDSVVQAYEGFGAFTEAKPELRAMMRLWPNYVQLVTIESTGIKSVEDLRGKKVGVGAPNSGVELNARMICEAYGMTYADAKDTWASTEYQKVTADLSRVTVWRWVKKFDWVLTNDDEHDSPHHNDHSKK